MKCKIFETRFNFLTKIPSGKASTLAKELDRALKISPFFLITKEGSRNKAVVFE